MSRRIISIIGCSLIATTALFGRSKEDSASIIKELDKHESYIIDSKEEERPVENYFDFTYTPELSNIVIPVDIQVSAVEKEINNTLSGVIYEDKVLEDDSLKIKVVKYGNIKIRFEGSKLSALVPLKVYATKRIGLGLKGVYTDRDMEAALNVKLSSIVSLNKDWTINSKTTITGYNWIEKPTVKVAGVNLPITTIVENEINKQKNSIAKSIDKVVKEELPVKEYAQDLWEQVQSPTQVDIMDYKAWFMFRPTTISISPILGANGTISCSLGITNKLEVSVNVQPTINIDKKLPDCIVNKSQTNGFTLNVLSDIPYSLLAKIATETLAGSTYGEGRHQVTVQHVNFYGSNDELGIVVNVKGFMNGDIYMTGTPYFDESRHVIRLKDVDYKLGTKNLIAKGINLLYKNSLKKKLEEEVKVNLQDEFYLVQQMGNSSVLNQKWTDNIYTNGNINNVEGKTIYITNVGVQSTLTLKGDSHLTYK